MEDTIASARCSSCGKGLPFMVWSRGGDRCEGCARVHNMSGPAATFVRGPSAARERARIAAEAAQYEKLLDELPDELVEELVAALEAEAAKMRAEPAPIGVVEPLRDVLQEIGFGRSAREMPWALWGFAGGFALNVGVAKYAQMASGSPMADFIGPLILGGVLAGATCAAIGWGLAKLLDR